MSAEVKICHNCVREIPIANYEMHFVHCQRKIQLCPSCNEPVPRSQLEEHRIEFHSVVKCVGCFRELESAELNEHKKKECPKRIVSCQYCDLDLRANDIPEHENYCGSRTEICEGCGKLVMLKFHQIHLDSNHILVKETEESNNDSEDDNNAYEAEDDEASSIFVRRNISGANCSRLHLNERYRNTTHHLEEHFDNLVVEGDRRRVRDRESTNHTFQQNFTPPDLVYLPCEFCQCPIVANELVLHQTGCRPDLVSFEPAPPKRYNTWRENVREEHEVHLLSDDSDDENVHRNEASAQNVIREEENNVMIPCEFCSMPFLLDAVNNHQLVCRDN